jgi:hypothetical protein
MSNESCLEKGNYKLVSSREESSSESEEQTSTKRPKDESSSETMNAKSSMWQTVCNLVSDLEGTGLLGLPYVIQQGGWLAIVVLTVVPFMCFYTGKILIECLYDKNSKDEKVCLKLEGNIFSFCKL